MDIINLRDAIYCVMFKSFLLITNGQKITSWDKVIADAEMNISRKSAKLARLQEIEGIFGKVTSF